MSLAAQYALVVIALANLAGLLVLVVLALGVFKQLRGLNENARAVLTQADAVLNKVRDTAIIVAERTEKTSGEVARRAEHIAELSEQVAERVVQRVDTTTAIVQEAVSGPVINVASVRAGIGKGLEVWQALSKTKGGNGK